MKISDEETKTLKRKTKFSDVMGHTVYSGDMVYLITTNGAVLEFSTVTGKVVKTKLKAKIE